MIDVCLGLWNRWKEGYEAFRNLGFVKLLSGRTLQHKKTILKQAPGLQRCVIEEMGRQAEQRKLSPVGYHGYISRKGKEATRPVFQPRSTENENEAVTCD